MSDEWERWQMGETIEALAKERGVTRERMRYRLEKLAAGRHAVQMHEALRLISISGDLDLPAAEAHARCIQIASAALRPSPWGDADELSRLRAEVERLRDGKRDMHRRAQSAEGQLSRLKWWYEALLQAYPVRTHWWLHKYASAALRGSNIQSGTAWELLHTVYKRALADERAHADALADTLAGMDGLQEIDCEMRDNALRAHRARRQG